MEKMQIEEVDMITALPQHILLKIMECLPFKQVVQTSTLSKTWLQAWRTYPVLLFDKSFFPRNDETLSSQKRIQMLMKFVEQTLRKRQRETILSKLVLDMDLLIGMDYASVLDRCLRYAVENGVEDLKLQFNNPPAGIGLPQLFKFFGAIFMIINLPKSIHVLKLGYCKLVVPASELVLSHLSDLNLDHVYLDDNTIESIVARCPSIKKLYLCHCFGFNSLELVGVDKLMAIILQDNKNLKHLKLEARNVKVVVIHGPFEDINLDSCRNMKHLDFGGVPILTDRWLSNEISKFPLLKGLSIRNCYNLRNLSISSHSLRGIFLMDCTNLVEVKVDSPELCILAYDGEVKFFWSDVSTSLITHVLTFPHNNNKANSKVFLRLIEYVNWMSTHMRTYLNEVVIVPNESWKNLPTPLSIAKRVKVKSTMDMQYPVKSIVDDILAMLPHTETITITYSEYTFCFKFSYVKKQDYGDTVCCYSKQKLPISCWKHCMEKVEIEIVNKRLGKWNNVRRHILRDNLWNGVDCFLVVF